jgi:LysM repeat protein
MKQLLFMILTFSVSTALISQSSDISCPPSAISGIHVVQPGETLYGISKKYKVTIANLRQWNNIAENAILPKCATLAVNNPSSQKSDVPTSYSYVGSKTTKTTVTPTYIKNSNKTHTVRDGESLASIADKYGYTVARLLAMNNMPNTQPIYVNQELVVSDCNCDAKVQSNNAANEIRSDVPQSYSNTNTNQIRNNIPQMYSNTPEIRTKTAESADYNTPKQVNYNWNPNYARVIHIVSQNNIALRETPQSIGALYGLTGEEVIAMNGLERNVALLPGQRLNIEDRRQLATTKSSTTYYPSNDIPTQYNSNLPLIKPKASESAPINNTPVNNAPVYNPPMEKATFNNPPFDDTPKNKTNANNTPNRNTTTNNVSSNAPMVANNTPMSSEEMTMVNEINLVRSNPAGYIPYIEQYIEYLKTNGNMGNSIATAKELIDELKRTPSLSVLQTLPCLYTAAKKHGDDQRKKGDTDHQGSDGSWPWDRVLRECKDLKDGNENLVGGPSDIRRAVILLLVDDGIEGRGHRKTMLQSDWKYIACHKMGTIGTMPNCWVQQFGN